MAMSRFKPMIPIFARPSARVVSRPSLGSAGQRFYAGGYGDGEGDPKSESPQKQGSNPSENQEHPGPSPVAEGQGSGAGATKGSGGGADSGRSASGGGAQPRIHDERDGPKGASSKDVEQHNREFENRHDRAELRDEGNNDKVHKRFWSGTASRRKTTMLQSADTTFFRPGRNGQRPLRAKNGMGYGHGGTAKKS